MSKKSSSPAPAVTDSFSIDKTKHGAIIGKGGSILKELQAKHNVKISVPKAEDSSDLVTVSGADANSVKAARTEIEGIAAAGKKPSSKPSTPVPSDLVESKHSVAKIKHAHIIGKGGSQIKKLKEETGVADIIFPSGEVDEITIRGKPEQIEACKKAIDKYLAKLDAERERVREEFADKTDKKYEKYMKDVEEHARKRAEYFEQAKVAFDKGDGAKAKELSEKGKLETELMEKAQQRAADKIFDEINKGRGLVATIDLHGQQVEGAIYLVEKHLAKAKPNSDGVKLTIITGKGLHSGDAGVKIRPAIIEWLNSKNYQFTEPDGGSIQVK